MAKVTKRAVLVGCNYANHQSKLLGCIHDAIEMRDLIVNDLGFDEVTVLTDKAEPPSAAATAANIKRELSAMVSRAEAGDVLFFYFSGYGTSIPVNKDGPLHREEKAIVSGDLYSIKGIYFRSLVTRLPEGATFTIVSDSGHSGGLIDGEKVQMGHEPSGEESTTLVTLISKSIDFRFVRDTEHVVSDSHPEDDGGILLSGCAPKETSYELVDAGIAYGAFTKSVLLKVSTDPCISNKDLVKEARKFIREKLKIYQQHPCLYCSDANADAPFLGGCPKNP
ncbi:hypothetical protein V6N13_092302 [Hibiscus sabdariffa]|uniref:Uncharacterized protein n=2 Tax=Hibiscus sabdariffa TaxID=183260 RepID=A0ABR2CBZ4_9ROSI